MKKGVSEKYGEAVHSFKVPITVFIVIVHMLSFSFLNKFMFSIVTKLLWPCLMKPSVGLDQLVNI